MYSVLSQTVALNISQKTKMKTSLITGAIAQTENVLSVSKELKRQLEITKNKPCCNLCHGNTHSCAT